MLRNRAVQMKLVSRLIIGGVVLGVEIKPGEGGDLQTDLAAQVAARRAGLEGPVVSANVRQVALVEAAGGRVNTELPLPFEVSVFPPHHQWKHLNVAEPVGRILLMNAGG